jgi:hypothetical protein
MPVPTCPICGREAADLSQQAQQAAHSAVQSLEKADAGFVICHCIENHRFVVSLQGRIQTEGEVRPSRAS